LLHQLREVVVPKIADPLAQQRAKGLARIVKHLREVNLHGQFYEQGELDDLAGALGAPPADVASGREALRVAARGGKVSDAAYLQVLWRRVARDEELLRSASGALADRHWPPLR
jgi:hypothetical protein